MHLHAACLEAQDEDGALDPSTVRQAVEATISLIGNANSEAIFERRRLLLSAIHPMLGGYATRDSFNPESDDLFGSGLQEKIRKAIDLNTDLNAFANSIPRAGKFLSVVAIYARMWCNSSKFYCIM